MTKQELKNYSRMNKELARLEEKIKVLRNKIESPKSAVLSGVTSSGERKDFTDYIDNIVELQEMYNRRAKAIIEEQIRIENAIARLDNPIERAVLGYYYIDGLTWEQICVKVNYSWNRIHHFHRKALINIKGITYE